MQKKTLKISDFFQEPEGKRPHGRTKSKLEDNNIWNFKKQDNMLRTGFISFGIGNDGRVLREQ